VPQALASGGPLGHERWVDDQRGTALDAGAIGAGVSVPVRAGWHLGLTWLAARRAIEVQHHADLRKGDSLILVTLARVTDKIR